MLAEAQLTDLAHLGNPYDLSIVDYLFLQSTFGNQGRVFLIRDEFATARAAGAVNGTPAEPGPGTRVVTDTGNFVSIAGGRFAASNVAGVADPSLWYAAQVRATGLAVLIRNNADQRVYLGWNDNQVGIADRAGLHLTGVNLQAMDNTFAVNPIATTLVVGVDYELATILRTAGSFHLLKGDAFLDWTLMWVAVSDTVANPLPGYTLQVGGNDIHSLDYFRVAQLAAPWNTDYGIATQQLAGARAPGDTFVHEADCHIEWEVDTLPSSGQIELWFRIQDALNYWAVTINAAGDLELDEVVAGVTTQRGVAAAAVANSDRVVIIPVGTTIDVFEGTIGQTRQIHYTSATNFQTETDGELDTEGTGGAVSDIISWPRIISGPARFELDRHAI